jgi:putative redox protein
MDTALVSYLGELRTEALHPRSGERILTDAPVDNRGKGAAFSPTDLLCTALATCMLTTMGISAQGHGIPIASMQARVVKHMASDPRRVQRVEVEITIGVADLTDRWRTLLEQSARTCPVALSLSSELVQDISIHFV